MKKRNFIATSMIIFMVVLVVNLLNSKISATSVNSPLYFGITETSTVTDWGYAFGRPSAGAERLWNIVQYDDSSYSNPSEADVYCLKADSGFNDNNKTQEYDISYNMKTDEKSMSGQNDILNGLVNGGQYDNLLALADILYVPNVSTETEKNQLLEVSGAMDVLKNYGLEEYEEYHLTDEDIEAVQQAAIWYFTN